MGKYQLVRRLATGGMAEVFLAKAAGPMGFEKELVVKRILPHLAEDPQFVEMFLTEAKLAARLNHANVVQIFDFGEQDESFFIAMEYVEGLNLRVLSQRAVRRGTPLPYPLGARIVSLACEGLAYAHELVEGQSGQPLGLIHRDVSTDNILVSLTGGVKVVDFGIAKAANQGQQTRSGALKGKLSYMAPEYLMGRPIDLRVDVYALGVVLYELVAGHKPFQAEGDAQLVQLIIHEQPTDVRARHPDVPDALFRIIDRALAKDREVRYANCRQLQADLERLIYHCGEPVGTQQIAEWVRGMAAVQTGEVAARRPSQERVATATIPPPAMPAPATPAPATPAPATPAPIPHLQTDPDLRLEPPPPLTGTTFVIYPKPLAQQGEAERTAEHEATGLLPKPPEEPTRLAPVSPLREAPTQRVPVLNRVSTAALAPAVADDEDVLRLAVGRRRHLAAGAVVAVLGVVAVAGYVVWRQMDHYTPVVQEPAEPGTEVDAGLVVQDESRPVPPEPPPELDAGVVDAGITPDPSSPDPSTPVTAPPESPIVEQRAPVDRLARLVVDSNLPGQVRINGKVIGRTPIARDVESGRLRVEVFGTAQGEQFDKAQVLRLKPGESKEVSFSIQRVSVQVRGRPDDMKALSLDSKPVDGEGRIITYEGRHRLRLLHTPTGKFYQSTCEARPGEKLCKFIVKEAL